VVDQLLTRGRVLRGWTGITRITDVGVHSGVLGPGQTGGVLVVELLRGSPADRAGLEPGDVVLALDGRAIEDAAHLRNELARAEVGAVLRFTVSREGRRVEVRVPVEEVRRGA
jgi:serine protease DegS